MGRGIRVSGLGWPAGALRRMADGLGWPRSGRDQRVSRETGRSSRHVSPHPEPITSGRSALPAAESEDQPELQQEPDSDRMHAPTPPSTAEQQASVDLAEHEVIAPDLARRPQSMDDVSGNALVVAGGMSAPATDGGQRLDRPTTLEVGLAPGSTWNSTPADEGAGELQTDEQCHRPGIAEEPAHEELTVDLLDLRQISEGFDSPDAMDRKDDPAAGESMPPAAIAPELLETDASVLSVTVTPAWTASQEPVSTSASQLDTPLVKSISILDDSTPLAMEVAEDTRRRLELVGRRFPRPERTRVITVANQKGGVGKTTTTVNLAAALAQAGLRVLVLDIDPQGNASTALGIDHHAEVPSVYDVLVEGEALKDVVQPCPAVDRLWCGPATIDLAGAEIELVSLVARESRLKRAVDAYLGERAQNDDDRLDYILIDCPPSLGLLTVNAFVAAREVLIPIQCEYYALEGLSQLLRNVELIKGHLNPELRVSTILLTMYDGRTRLSSQVADEVRAHFPEQVLRTTVPRSVRISEAPSHQETVMTYDPASSGALSYLEAARELAEQVLGDTEGLGS